MSYPGTAHAFHIMLKPRGAICNLDCQYCYYLSKTESYPGGTFRMSDQLLEKYTRDYIDAQAEMPSVTFTWQGGEPTLMGLGFFRRAVEFQNKYRKPGMQVHNALQTNATLLDDVWCEFFRQNEFLIGVSLDGPRELHDAFRCDKRGSPTFDRVMEGVTLFKQHKVEFNVLTSVHAANADYPLQVYRFLRDEVGTQFVQFIPIVEREPSPGSDPGVRVTERSVTGKQYGQFLISIFDEWVRRDVGRLFVQTFDVALGVWMGQPAALCVLGETCGRALAMEHNGDLFSCDHFVDPRYKLGNLDHASLVGMVDSEQQHQFGDAKRDTLPRTCRECTVRFVCNGGCPKDRILTAPDGEAGLDYLCAGYKAFFNHIDRPMRTMAELLNRQRPPADIMYLF